MGLRAEDNFGCYCPRYYYYYSPGMSWRRHSPGNAYREKYCKCVVHAGSGKPLVEKKDSISPHATRTPAPPSYHREASRPLRPAGEEEEKQVACWEWVGISFGIIGTVPGVISAIVGIMMCLNSS